MPSFSGFESFYSSLLFKPLRQRLVETGTHAELNAIPDGLYRRLSTLPFQGFAET